MKIKLKPISSILSYLLPICYILIVAAGVWWLKEINLFSWSEAWGMLLQAAKKDSLFIFILLRIFPWLVLFFLAVAIWEFFQKHKSCSRTPRITSISFEKEGIVLQQNLARPAVFLPYTQTDFSLCVLITVGYNKHHQPVPRIVGVEMSFSSAKEHLSAQHTAGFSIIQKILNEGKKFRSFSTQVKPANKEAPSTQDEKDFILFVQEQLDNYLRYGLMRHILPTQLSGFLILGIVTGVFSLFLVRWVWQVVPQASLFMIFAIVVLVLATLTICIWCFYQYMGEKRIAKQLEALKGPTQK